ncbi:MAG: DUF2080 family transposase-associated protein [Proteobacteria bacterium]|nr:DUF2080 family transposase-associated protein [Pseudomonadota bacterium]MBU4574127.1 DUF2080 family transposase-associated protein [Pseudomonadota bacterium]MBU4597996.1 DUF2080 family transposase-associated protein [Pseudomonadota bacterium]MBV1714442.1 DUF2080 family transposase-associated protein [Desulfarculus sp.]MBV1750037.1 DUF2080 family transposase-associated protein [Desulfarculus sp.]
MKAPPSPGSRPADGTPPGASLSPGRAKFEVYGEEMMEKTVHQTGNTGRIYLPQSWIGKRVKIILVKR